MERESSPDGCLSFLLIKPDGVASDLITAAVDSAIQNRELRATFQADTTLLEQDIRYLWSHMPLDSSPLGAEMIRHYLMSGKVRLIVTAGARAIDSCSAIKNDIRRVHAVGPFANCIHAPSTEAELLRQIAYFGKLLGIPECPTVVVSAGEHAESGIWGRLADYGNRRLRLAARRVWSQSRKVGWSSVWQGSSGGGGYALVLIPDDHNSMDFAASGVAEIMSSWIPERVLSAVIEADIRGQVVLCHGDRDAVDVKARRLTSLGLTAAIATSLDLPRRPYGLQPTWWHRFT